MSIAALNWAFSVPVEGPPKAVLVALANHANEACECWPNQERIALHSGFAARTVRKAIEVLKGLGLVVEGKSFYTLVVGAEIEKPARGAARAARPKRHVVPIEPAPRAKPVAPRAALIENHQEPSKEPPIQKRQTALILPMVGGKGGDPPTLLPTLPPWLPRDAWAGFVEHRRKMPKVPFTPRAVDLIIRELAGFRAAGHDIEAILNTAVMNGWRGVFAPKPGVAGAPRQTAAQAARASHMEPPAWATEGPTIEGEPLRDYGG